MQSRQTPAACPTGPNRLRWGLGAGLLWASVAWAQAPHTPASIFTCIDAQGRKLTADRPIAACVDREQRELSPSGALRRIIPPTLTAQERAQQEAQRLAAQQAQARLRETQRREHVLVMRFPHPEAHQLARAQALRQWEQAQALLQQRSAELERQRLSIAQEMEFYQRDPSQAPAWLQRKQADHLQQQQSHAHLSAQHALERQHIEARFDEELRTLERLWSAAGNR